MKLPFIKSMDEFFKIAHENDIYYSFETGFNVSAGKRTLRIHLTTPQEKLASGEIHCDGINKDNGIVMLMNILMNDLNSDSDKPWRLPIIEEEGL